MRKFAPLLLMVAFGLLATGCTSSNNTTAAAPQVRIWRVNQDIDTLRDVIRDFSSANSKVKVTYSKKTADNYELKSLRSMAGRQGPDIWSIPSDWIGDEEQLLVPLPSNYFFAAGKKTGTDPVTQVQSLFPTGIADQIVSPDNKVWGLPTNVDTLILYYNPDMFQTALAEFRKSLGDKYTDAAYLPVQQLLRKAPTTWNDVVDQSKYLTQRTSDTITRSTIALGSADNIATSADILQLMMMQNGAKIVSSKNPRSALFNYREATAAGGQVRPGEKALDFYTSFAIPSKANYTWNDSMANTLDAFGNGQVAMVIAFSDFGQALKIKFPKFHPETAPVPQISLAQPAVNLIKFSLETVTQTADSPSSAFAFLKAYNTSNIANSLAHEQKLESPYLTTLKNEDTFQSKQIITGEAIYKRSHTQFDSTFHQMINDVLHNNVVVGLSLDNGADAVNQLLNPVDQ